MRVCICTVFSLCMYLFPAPGHALVQEFEIHDMFCLQAEEISKRDPGQIQYITAQKIQFAPFDSDILTGEIPPSDISKVKTSAVPVPAPENNKPVNDGPLPSGVWLLLSGLIMLISFRGMRNNNC